MRSIHISVFAALVLGIVAFPGSAFAGSLVRSSSPLVDHPVRHPLDGRSGALWRQRVGAWGENFAEQTLRLRGFNEIHEIKTGSNNGIDRIAVKRGTNSEVLDAKFVEVKTSRSAKPLLGKTRYGGVQMSRKWLASNLSAMRRSSDPELRKLALELSRFRKASGRPIESLGELIHINTQSDRIVGYSADAQVMRYDESIERLLKELHDTAGTEPTQRWAARNLSEWDQIRSANMSSWLGKTASQQSSKSVLADSGRRATAIRAAVLRDPHRAVASRVLRRSVGRIALLIALAVDAKELYDTEYAFRTGAISIRQRNLQLITTLGGMAGAFGGAAMGGTTGAWIGAFGGPFAWITVPAGGFFGAVVGGVGGYFGGSAIAGHAAYAWYDSIDASVRMKFETAWLNSPPPQH